MVQIPSPQPYETVQIAAHMRGNFVLNSTKKCGGVTQLARVVGSYPACHPFESDRRYHERKVRIYGLFLMPFCIDVYNHNTFELGFDRGF